MKRALPANRGTLFSRARNCDERRFQATRRDVARALILFRRTIAALRHAKEAAEDGVAVVEREIGMKQLDGVLPPEPRLRGLGASEGRLGRFDLPVWLGGTEHAAHEMRAHESVEMSDAGGSAGGA
jgi:hypothetical protein